jgi:hypothetical protein
LHKVIRDADPAMKAAVYDQLRLKITYLPGGRKIRADVTISPDKPACQNDEGGVMGRARGGTAPKDQCLLAAEFAFGHVA